MAGYLHGFNGWLPSHPAVYNAFVGLLHNQLDQRLEAAIAHNPAVNAFGAAIRDDPIMLNLFNKILLETQPNHLGITNLDRFLHLLDVIVAGPPKFQTADGAVAEPIGVPMYLVFDMLSNTSAAYDLFRMPAFNTALQALLRHWGAFLQTPASNTTLNTGPNGWFSQAAINMLEAAGRGTFNETYVVPDPSAPDRGYTSWDAFFTRQVQAAARPLETLPDYPRNRIIFNACESTVERWRFRVKAHDRFWLKGSPYSLYDMFNQQAHAQQFEGGTVYQAFLSPQDYHRWHSPIDGRIEAAYIVPGTYYAALPDRGVFDDEEYVDSRGALIRSQPWLTMSATRAVIIIQGAAPIGRVGLIGVGMAEVSSCQITVNVGDNVQAGQELGMFHFGGSSHALIFQPGAGVRFLTEEGVVRIGNHIRVNRALGVSVA